MNGILLVCFIASLALVAYTSYNLYSYTPDPVSPSDYPDLRGEYASLNSKYLETRELLGNLLKSHPEIMGRQPIDLEDYDDILI